MPYRDSLATYRTNLFIFSAPKSNKAWIGSGKLNCRGATSPGPMEAVFFGPQVANSAKCGGGSSSRIAHARIIHKEICALLLGALESLRMNLCEFCTVLPAQWATLTGSTQPVSTIETEQRLNKLVDSAKVCAGVNALKMFIHTESLIFLNRHLILRMILLQKQTRT